MVDDAKQVKSASALRQLPPAFHTQPYGSILPSSIMGKRTHKPPPATTSPASVRYYSSRVVSRLQWIIQQPNSQTCRQEIQPHREVACLSGSTPCLARSSEVPNSTAHDLETHRGVRHCTAPAVLPSSFRCAQPRETQNETKRRNIGTKSLLVLTFQSSLILKILSCDSTKLAAVARCTVARDVCR